MHLSTLRVLPPAVAAALVLAGCGGHATEETTHTVTRDGVTTTTITTRAAGDARATATAAGSSGLSIDSDQFKANIDIPGMSFGGEHMNLDGIKLYPGSTVKGMHVHAVDRPGIEKGEVVVDFTSPAAPVTVAQHMADAARRAGYTLTVNSAAQVGGSKADGNETKRFAVTLGPNGEATAGQMTLTGNGQ